MAEPYPFIASNVESVVFRSPYDGTGQTSLLKDYRDTPSAPCPLLAIYLHGSHNHQEQGMTAGIYHNAFGRFGELLENRKAVYVCPEYRGNSWMGPAAEADLTALIDHLQHRLRPRYTLLLGGSMGGTSALIYAMRNRGKIDGVLAFCPATSPAEMFDHDERFRADMIASYGGTPEENPEEYRQRTVRTAADKFAGLPMVIIHGTHDSVIPIHHSEQFVEALRQIGGDACCRYHAIEHGDHDAPLAVSLEPYLAFIKATV